MSQTLAPHADRLLPAEPGVRSVARHIYESIRDLPIISPHGHVDARLFVADDAFDNPTSLFLSPDHYTTRLLHANGVSLADLGVGRSHLSDAEARSAWRIFCSKWHIFAGTPVQFWFESVFADIFGVTQVPSPETADAIYDRIAAALATPAFRPRALRDRFRIDVLATTDDPSDALSAHAALATDPDFRGRVIPTFRPDRYLEAAKPGWHDALQSLATASGIDTGTLTGFTAAMENRRAFFKATGAATTDHSHVDALMTRLAPEVAATLFARAVRGDIAEHDAAALRRHLLWDQARMATEDGLVMTLHHGVYRNHHDATLATYGADTGHDIPLTVEWVRGLREVLNDFGTHPNMRMVLFTLDPDTWAREIATLAGFYPSVFIGSPWWFFDAPDAIRRWRAATSEIAGFTRYSGFIDDTRAFFSIPARHDMSRRLDAGFLATLVAEHRISEATALETAAMWTDAGPRAVFKL